MMGIDKMLERRATSIAVVSGKGGSGKTLVVTAMAQGLALEGKRVVIIDADLGTGGLTYYLGFSVFSRARNGFTEYIRYPEKNELNLASVNITSDNYKPYLDSIKLMPIGDHQILERETDEVYSEHVFELIEQLRPDFDVILFDCRGGIDSQSLAVCSGVDEIVMIVETDAASIKASQHLSEVLAKKSLKHKVAGFLLNKVMDDPTTLANTGRSFFNADFLGAIPFDIETTRSFIKGDLPSVDSLFARHVFAALNKVSENFMISRKQRVLSNNEFSTLSLEDPEIRLGKIVIALIIAYLIISYIFFTRFYSANPNSLKLLSSREFYDAILVGTILFSLLSMTDTIRKFVGRLAATYIKFTRKIINRNR